MKNEIWKDIKGYENKYQVSNKGRVKRLEYQRNGKTYPEKILKQRYVDELPTVNLFRKDQSEKMLVRNLVADAFLEGCSENKILINKDGVKSNNYVDNLACINPKDKKDASHTEINKNDKEILVFKNEENIYSGHSSRDVAEYLILNNYIDNSNIDTVSRGIRKAIQNKKNYKGFSFKEIKLKRYTIKSTNITKSFDTINEISDWLLRSGIAKDVKKETLTRSIRKAIKENKLYHNFQIINNN